FRLLRHDGVYRWMVAHGLPRYDPAGGFAGFAGAFTDITERRAAEQQLHQTNKALESELSQRIRSQQQVQALTARLMKAHEEERTRIARELHDDLSQQIAATSIATSNLKKQIAKDPVEALAQTARLQQKLIGLAQAVRRLSHELHPSVLQHAGLAAALRTYCEELAALTAYKIGFTADGDFDDLPPPVALSVYRVARESLQNSIKHSGV